MRGFQFCYDLGSIEPSKGQPERPRSIRQSALYHALDIETGRTDWIIIKGDHLLKKRIKSTTSSRGLPGAPCLGTVDRAFTSTLANHVVLCEWSGENRRRCMNFLDEALQATTRPVLSAIVDPFPGSIVNEETSTLAQCASSNTVINLCSPVLRRPPTRRNNTTALGKFLNGI